jgi:hypothetical protein
MSAMVLPIPPSRKVLVLHAHLQHPSVLPYTFLNHFLFGAYVVYKVVVDQWLNAHTIMMKMSWFKFEVEVEGPVTHTVGRQINPCMV